MFLNLRISDFETNKRKAFASGSQNVKRVSSSSSKIKKCCENCKRLHNIQHEHTHIHTQPTTHANQQSTVIENHRCVQVKRNKFRKKRKILTTQKIFRKKFIPEIGDLHRKRGFLISFQKYLCHWLRSSKSETVASSESTSGGDSALFSKLGGAFFGGSNSPQKVIANVRGLLANRLTGALPDTGKKIRTWIES